MPARCRQVDLARKLLLTSVVLLVGPDSLVQVRCLPAPSRTVRCVSPLLLGLPSVPQLWFVTTTGLVFLVLFLALSPYRDVSAGRIQIAALVQLEFTYVTAALFFDRPPKAPQGEVLVLCNSLVALVMVGVAVRGIGPTPTPTLNSALTLIPTLTTDPNSDPNPA